MRVLRLLVGVLAVVLGLVGCTDQPSTEEPTDTMSVTGAFGRAPIVSFDVPLPLTEGEAKVIVEGEGRELAADQPALLALTAYDGDDGAVLEDRGAGEARTLLLTPDDVGEDLYDVLVGATEGSRLLVTQPISAEDGDRMLVLVIDVLPTSAQGEAVAPPEGSPTVTVGADGAPVITLPDAEPPSSLEVIPLIRGEGDQVRPGQEVTLQYTAVTWPGGEVYDSTWAAGALPRTVAIDDTFPGLRDGLIDQRVGSRVLLIVPPALGAGTHTLVMVVDILATAGGDGEVVVPSPATTE
ncbi:FKBP-type peptidyl-prolyl cis-trans isomerase [Georgenia faecalis]|uniref:FKBP-type peptidyl-prolyl cis-trans isomerase n=1 Tax=Georgenia faecalis TaxID=2483799 RepID=UPI0013E04A3E|nr:FKBP-type peptidyl-prolyl cis-trans isomerase [Georgenia faecalis]